MTEEYKATPEQWEQQERRVRLYLLDDQDAPCLLELRSRVEVLEEAENDRRFEAAKALIDKHDPQRPRVPTVKDALTVAPAGSLVARVLSAMAHAPDGFGYEQEARAAIREVAAWLREQGTPASGWAMRLEAEAER
jgi:hypothetical protein